MKLFFLSAGVLWIAVAATAQTPTPPLNWVKDVVPDGATGPSADGLHNCLASYPERERAARVEGTTSLSYHVAEDGSVQAVKVRKSSGNAALDKAAVACVKDWRYIPAKLDEKPIEVSWRNDVKWVLNATPMLEYPAPPPVPSRPGPPPPPPPGSPPPVNTITLPSNHPTSPPPINVPIGSIGRPHVCVRDYPADAVAEHAQGTVTLGYIITVEGKVENLHIVVSSGYAALDDAALSCASTWRYKPAIKDNQPIAVPWKAEVKWLMR